MGKAKRLEDARGLATQSSYDAALAILETLLKESPANLAYLRLRGNLLELREMNRLEDSLEKLPSSSRYVAARRCYEKILRIDPGNIKAHIDLGHHYLNLGAKRRALERYGAAAGLLQRLPKGQISRDDVQEIASAVALLRSDAGLAAGAASIEAWCKQALSNTR